ncbi:6127_t:CDS:2 [Entrophospora sp. SA101]|nr:6127_t:CDS:2 [Entrophospora sp. SA101]CAJ0835921.1 13441_t:CDS:2 [Entrophospora sp. SA101]
MFNVYSIIITFLIYIRLVKAYSPGARSFHASIRNDTKLYFFGGYIDDYSVGGDAFYLDLEESFSRTLPKWIEKSKANIEIMHSSVCKTARDSFIFIGGTYRKSDHMPDKETPFIEYNHKYDIWSLPYNAEPFDWRINVQCVSDNEGSINVYDTKINKWSLISARGQDIGSREYHSAVLGPDDSIIVFGGHDYHEKQYPYPHLAILNITRISCEWSIPKVSNNADTPPLLYAHSYESSISGHEKYSEELYIFDMESHSWVNKFAYLSQILDNRWDHEHLLNFCENELRHLHKDKWEMGQQRMSMST